jgi:hypothetical protein
MINADNFPFHAGISLSNINAPISGSDGLFCSSHL